MPPGISRSPKKMDIWRAIFPGLAGAFLGLAMLKFGNPVILEHQVPPPQNLMELIFQGWPVAWGYGVLVLLVLAGLKAGKLQTNAPYWIIGLPLVWLGWQFLAGLQTVDVRLTRETLQHFSACVVCFYLGLLVLSRAEHVTLFWAGILIGFLYVLWAGFGQHYGGLEQTRQFVFRETNWRQLPPEYLKKLQSDRIFSTLVYPNALAGVILLLLPAMLLTVWQMSDRFGQLAQAVLTGLVGYAGIACMIWSGSKAGWLIGLSLGFIILFQLPLRRIAKLGIFWGILILGLAGFFIRYAAYFERGATSVGARLAYWQAALKIAGNNPVFGSGPGTFSIEFQRIKLPESEMAKLTHNDYLEQASDSGVIGFVSYFSVIFVSLATLYRHRLQNNSVRNFTVWLGLMGWAVQSFFEFNLYIPALAWPTFMFLGLLLGQVRSRNQIDTSPTKLLRIDNE